MASIRHGSPTGFFDGVTTYGAGSSDASASRNGGVAVPNGPNTFSIRQEVGRQADNFAFFVSVLGSPAFATQWVLQVAHSGAITAQTGVNRDPNDPSYAASGGIFADPDSTTYVWHDAYYLGTSGTGNSTQIRLDIPSGGGSIMSFCPDFNSGWARLRRVDANGAVTVVAGWEIQSD